MDYVKNGMIIVLVLFAIAIVSLISWIFLHETNPIIDALLPVISIGSIMLAFLIGFLGFLIDIITAKNDISWKLLWGVVILFGVLGWVVYLVFGRKERKN
jgi:hypothetical protein